jgi:hypothetical protein
MSVTQWLVFVTLFLVVARVWYLLNGYCSRYRHLPRGDSSHILFGDATVFVKAFLGFYDIPLYAGTFLSSPFSLSVRLDPLNDAPDFN